MIEEGEDSKGRIEEEERVQQESGRGKERGNGVEGGDDSKGCPLHTCCSDGVSSISIAVRPMYMLQRAFRMVCVCGEGGKK